ncbi:glycogen debranching enzyme [Moniliophthora roreri]|nr:glycogen debranching enzyme [Moniliophthora roreri]
MEISQISTREVKTFDKGKLDGGTPLYISPRVAFVPRLVPHPHFQSRVCPLQGWGDCSSQKDINCEKYITFLETLQAPPRVAL